MAANLAFGLEVEDRKTLKCVILFLIFVAHTPILSQVIIYKSNNMLYYTTSNTIKDVKDVIFSSIRRNEAKKISQKVHRFLCVQESVPTLLFPPSNPAFANISHCMKEMAVITDTNETVNIIRDHF